MKVVSIFRENKPEAGLLFKSLEVDLEKLSERDFRILKALFRKRGFNL